MWPGKQNPQITAPKEGKAGSTFSLSPQNGSTKPPESKHLELISCASFQVKGQYETIPTWVENRQAIIDKVYTTFIPYEET